jgi:nitroimidazol reductase NimA-like FMN-containing flavoprotein (pyridoxamine 5'-phosphate oxidase superfamily)
MTDRATIRVHPDRAVPDETESILDAGLVAHVGFVDDGQPVVIPMTYHVEPEDRSTLYLHGGHHSRLMRHLASGAPVCVTVTLVDGLVYSKTALNHSVNYRSVVCFGRAAATPADAATQARVLAGLIGRYFPGRTAGRDYEAPPAAHLAATAFVAVRIEAASAKARRGGPTGPRDDDPTAAGTAGVVAVGPCA